MRKTAITSTNVPITARPAANQSRWFRTPNDAFMTGNFHVRASLLQKALTYRKLSWFQLLLASTYSGAFHPTAEGHVLIANALHEFLRGHRVLGEHGISAATPFASSQVR